MIGTTHVAVGFAMSLVIWNQEPLPAVFALGCISALAALLPDIDHAGSSLGRRVIVGSWVFRHRGFTHSPLALVLLMLLCWRYVVAPVPLAVGVGYGSHLLLDALNPQGIPLLYPFKWRLSLFKFRTGGLVDTVMGSMAALAVFLILAWLSTGRGW